MIGRTENVYHWFCQTEYCVSGLIANLAEKKILFSKANPKKLELTICLFPLLICCTLFNKV